MRADAYRRAKTIAGAIFGSALVLVPGIGAKALPRSKIEYPELRVQSALRPAIFKLVGLLLAPFALHAEIASLTLGKVNEAGVPTVYCWAS